MQCRKCLRIFGVHLGQFREFTYCLFRNGKAFLPACGLRLVDPQEDAPAEARIDDALSSQSDIEESVALRHALIPEIVIRLCEIAPTALGML